jgi:hypothetical protein
VFDLAWIKPGANIRDVERTLRNTREMTKIAEYEMRAVPNPCEPALWTRLTARHLERDGRGALMFCRCFMFQMFQSPLRPRARDSPFIAAPTTPTNRSR